MNDDIEIPTDEMVLAATKRLKFSTFILSSFGYTIGYINAFLVLPENAPSEWCMLMPSQCTISDLEVVLVFARIGADGSRIGTRELRFVSDKPEVETTMDGPSAAEFLQQREFDISDIDPGLGMIMYGLRGYTHPDMIMHALRKGIGLQQSIRQAKEEGVDVAYLAHRQVPLSELMQGGHG